MVHSNCADSNCNTCTLYMYMYNAPYSRKIRRELYLADCLQRMLGEFKFGEMCVTIYGAHDYIIRGVVCERDSADLYIWRN